ncbi:MAG: amidohydrolase [Bacteroidota bacterium]
MKKIFGFLALATIILLIGYQYLMKDFKQTKSLIFQNGVIYTLENDAPKAQAVLVEDGYIKAVGSNDEVLSLKTPKTEIIDLEGKTMFPGFIDPHTHMALSSFLHPMVDLSGFKHRTPEQVWNHLRESVKNFEKGAWIVCKGLDPILVEGLDAPKIDMLDEMVPDNPLIILSQSLHTYWGNTMAFSRVGIDKDTPDPSQSSYYERTPQGELTGLIAEQLAFAPFAQAILGAVDSKTLINAAVDVMKAYAKRGNTTLVTTGISVNDSKPLRLYKHLSAEKPEIVNQALSKLGMLPKRAPLPRHFIYIRHDRLHLMPESPQNGDDFYRVLGVKHWYDGSPYTGSMYLSQPYLMSELSREGLHIKEGYAGEPLVEHNELVNWITTHQQAGWQVLVHTQGDLAINEVLEAFEAVENAGNEIAAFRHRLEHCLLMDSLGIVKAKALNVNPSFHINHLYYYGKALKNDLIGEKLAEKMLPLRSALDAGMTISLHADQPMFESHPFSLIRTAVERKTKEGELLGEREVITLDEAIRSLTIDAAWQIKMEDKLGSIKTGKFADLIILDHDPYSIPVTELDKIEVLATYIHGNQVAY